jgi:putative salt-induced outer membrane protein
MNWRSLLTLGLLALAMPLLAQEDEETEEDSPWSGSVTLGYLATTGNTEGSSLNSGAEINYALELWEHQATAAAFFKTEDKITTDEAYDAGWKSARNLTEHDYMYGRLNWRKDRFGSILEQFSQTIGYGRRLINKEKHQLNGELGFGARQSERSDGTNENDGIYTGRLTYTWQISETASFGQSFLVESGDSNTFTESVTNLRARLLGDLALVASYTIRQNSDVVQGDFKTDTRSSLSLEYAF